jgi:hypothetical protein
VEESEESERHQAACYEQQPPVLLQPRQRYSSLHGNSNQYGNSVFEINRGGALNLLSVGLGLGVRHRRLRNAAPAKSAGLMRAIGPRRKKHERACVCVDIYTLGEHQGRRAISASTPARSQRNPLP